MNENKILFYFTRNNQTLALDDTEYSVDDYEGLEATDYELEKSARVNYIGETLKRKKILSRLVLVSFDYVGADADKSKKRQELIQFFSPFSSGELRVNYMGVERSIKYEVSAFQINSKNVHDQLSCRLELDCMDPAFESATRYGEEISTWISGWAWPFTLPFHMRLRGEKKKNICNNGDMETPVEIIFRGPAVNPCVINHAAGQRIQVERTLTADDALHIYTEFGNPRVEIETNGIITDAFQDISFDTRFFRLLPGDNMIEYSTENELDPQGVEIRYRERYLGI